MFLARRGFHVDVYERRPEPSRDAVDTGARARGDGGWGTEWGWQGGAAFRVHLLVLRRGKRRAPAALLKWQHAATSNKQTTQHASQRIQINNHAPGRAYIIILIPRGQRALADLGVPLPTKGHCMSQGTVRHSRAGKVTVSKEAGNVTFSRAGLAQFLIDEVRRDERCDEKGGGHWCSVCIERSAGVGVWGRRLAVSWPALRPSVPPKRIPFLTTPRPLTRRHQRPLPPPPPPSKTKQQKKARRLYPDRITFHFNSSCAAVDLAAKTATFVAAPADAAGASGGGSSSGNGSPAVQQQQEQVVKYDLLVGADGTQSAVRAAMQSADPAMTVEIADSGRE